MRHSISARKLRQQLLGTSLGFVLLLVLDDAGRELAAVGTWGEGLVRALET